MRSAFNQAIQGAGGEVEVDETGSDSAQPDAGCGISTGICAAIGTPCRLERTADVDRFCFKVGHSSAA
jgi:hypothetical protein